jgi:hypothetical protein
VLASACRGLVPALACGGLVPASACRGLVPALACDGLVPALACDGLVPALACDGLVQMPSRMSSASAFSADAPSLFRCGIHTSPPQADTELG